MFFLGQLEELNSCFFCQWVYLFLVITFALEEEDEIAQKEDEAKDCEKDPESWEGYDVYKDYGQPEYDGKKLYEPKYYFITSWWFSILRWFKAPNLLIFLIKFSVPS